MPAKAGIQSSAIFMVRSWKSVIHLSKMQKRDPLIACRGSSHYMGLYGVKVTRVKASLAIGEQVVS